MNHPGIVKLSKWFILAQIRQKLKCISLKYVTYTQPILVALRVRVFLHQTFQAYHVCCNFILGYICRITENFGTLKDGSLLINISSGFQTSDVSICNGNKKNPIGTSTFYTDFLRSSSSMFPLLLLIV